MGRIAQKALAVLLGVSGALGLVSPARAATVATTPDPTATFDGPIHSILYVGSTVYVAGEFTHAYAAGRIYGRGYLAAIDATTGALLGWNPRAGGPVRALAAAGGVVFALGDFESMGGLPRHHLAALDGGTGAVLLSFAQYVDGPVYSAAVGNGRLYIGGQITAVDGIARAGVAAFSLLTGALDTFWQPAVDDRVETVVATADRVYLGGRFHSVNAASGTAKLAAVDPLTGALDRSFDPSGTSLVRALAVTQTGVYAGIGGAGGRVVAYDLAGTERWRRGTDGDVQAVAVLAGTVYFGGHFDNVCRTARVGTLGACLDGSESRVKFAAVDQTGALLPWAPVGNGTRGVFAMVTDGVHLAAGGTFTTINGVSQRRFAQFPVLAD